MTETASEAVRTYCGSGNPSETVVIAVADAKGVDPLDLEPLNDVVDPDALDKLFQSTGTSLMSGELRFSMDGCQVVVRGDGEVVVTPATASDESATAVASHED